MWRLSAITVSNVVTERDNVARKQRVERKNNIAHVYRVTFDNTLFYSLMIAKKRTIKRQKQNKTKTSRRFDTQSFLRLNAFSFMTLTTDLVNFNHRKMSLLLCSLQFPKCKETSRICGCIRLNGFPH